METEDEHKHGTWWLESGSRGASGRSLKKTKWRPLAGEGAGRTKMAAAVSVPGREPARPVCTEQDGDPSGQALM